MPALAAGDPLRAGAALGTVRRHGGRGLLGVWLQAVRLQAVRLLAVPPLADRAPMTR